MALTIVQRNFQFNEQIGLEDGYLLYFDIGTGLEFMLKAADLDKNDIAALEEAEAAVGPFPVAALSLLNDHNTYTNLRNGQTILACVQGRIVQLGAEPTPGVHDVWNNSVYWDGVGYKYRYDNSIV